MPTNVRAVIFTMMLLWVAVQPATSQPSSGSYGPVYAHYAVPSDANTVYYVAPDGKSGADGGSADAPTTIEAAFERASTGDAIILRGGVYRTGDLLTNKGIMLQPYQGERPILKGTRVATEWEPVRGGLWRTRWETLFPAPPADWWRRESEITRTALHKFNNDMVFINGDMLQSAAWAGDVDNNSYWIDYDQGYVYIGFNPGDALVEITAKDVAIHRTIDSVRGEASDKKGLIVRGITFSQYAFRAIEIEGRSPNGPADESTYGKDVVGTTFEDCTFEYCSRVAGYFRGNDLVIRRCLVRETGTEGIFVLGSNDALLENNIITRNNNELITGYFVTAVKIFNQCHRVICRNNLIIDHPGDSSGLWYDVGNRDGVFVNNWIEDTDNGFFFEISKRVICAGNIFVDCYTGIKILNSSDARIYNNTMVNSRIHIMRTERSAQNDHFGWHPATGPDVDERENHEIVGNLMFAETRYTEPLVRFDQAQALSGQLNDPQVTRIESNIYVRETAQGDRPLIVWSPNNGSSGNASYDSLEDFRADFAEFVNNSRAYTGYYGPLFRGNRIGRFETDPDFAGADLEISLPDDIRKALGVPEGETVMPGAIGLY